MKKTTILVIISSLIAVFILGWYLGNKNLDTTQDFFKYKLDSITAGYNVAIDSLKTSIQSRNDKIDSLKESYNNLKVVKEERITIVKNLSNEEAVKYLENKLNVNKIDSLTFFSDSILGKVNALIEEGVIVKEELKNADSIIVAQDSLIQDQDSLINVILERESEELNFYEEQTSALNKELKKEKKKRKFFQGTTIIGSIIILLLL